jgi:hypothetical protein
MESTYSRALRDHLYAPSSQEMAVGLTDLAESLMASALDLKREQTPERCDIFSSRLHGAMALVGKLRVALLRETTPDFPPEAA